MAGPPESCYSVDHVPRLAAWLYVKNPTKYFMLVNTTGCGVHMKMDNIRSHMSVSVSRLYEMKGCKENEGWRDRGSHVQLQLCRRACLCI